jgi:ABC-type transport system substrate-binding protein
VRVQKLLAGECHVTSPLRDVDVVSRSPRRPDAAQPGQDPGAQHLLPGLQPEEARRSNQRAVREALDIAVDRDAVFKALFPRGDALQAVSAIPPSIPGFNDSLKNEFNPARAKQPC